MLAHKQDDGDREGKKIASEAGRRYIMIPAAGLKSSGRTPTSDLAASRKQRYASPSKGRLVLFTLSFKTRLRRSLWVEWSKVVSRR